MATSSLLEELKRLAAGPQLGQKPLGAPAATPFPAAPVAPTVGPTLANEAAAQIQPPAIDPGQAAPPVLDPNQEATFDFSGAIEKFPEDLGLTEQVRPTFDQPMISSTPDQGLKPFDQGGETLFVNPAGRRQLGGVNPPTDITPPPSILSPQATEVAPAAPQAPLGGIEQVAPPALSAGQQALQDAGEAAGTRARADGTFADPRNTSGPDSRDRDRTGRISFEEARRRVPTERDARGNITNRAEQRAAMNPEVVKDDRTPEKVEADRLANERSRQIIDEGNKPEATAFAKKRGEFEERAESLKEMGMDDDEIEARRKAFLTGDKFDEWQFNEDKKGKSPPPAEGEAQVASTGGYTSQEESGIQKVMSANNVSREEAIKALEGGGKLKKKTMNSSGSQ